MNLNKLWLYYRHGMAYYATPPVQAINFIILFYVVLGDKVFFIRDVFPHIVIFGLFLVGTALPLMMLIGWIHYRRAHKSESEVLTENNTYSYKLIGKDYIIVMALKELLLKQKDPDLELISKLDRLLDGSDTRDFKKP